MLDEEAFERHLTGALLMLVLMTACQVDYRRLSPPKGDGGNSTGTVEAGTGGGGIGEANGASGPFPLDTTCFSRSSEGEAAALFPLALPRGRRRTEQQASSRS